MAVQTFWKSCCTSRAKVCHLRLMQNTRDRAKAPGIMCFCCSRSKEQTQTFQIGLIKSSLLLLLLCAFHSLYNSRVEAQQQSLRTYPKPTRRPGATRWLLCSLLLRLYKRFNDAVHFIPMHSGIPFEKASVSCAMPRFSRRGKLSYHPGTLGCLLSPPRFNVSAKSIHFWNGRERNTRGTLI